MTPASFAPVLADKDLTRALLLGTGPRPGVCLEGCCARRFAMPVSPLEAMNTGAACRTFNVLLGEGRPVAAALIAVD